jgi:hypothetical protein
MHLVVFLTHGHMNVKFVRMFVPKATCTYAWKLWRLSSHSAVAIVLNDWIETFNLNYSKNSL